MLLISLSAVEVAIRMAKERLIKSQVERGERETLHIVEYHNCKIMLFIGGSMEWR